MIYASRFLRLSQGLMRGPDVLHLQEGLRILGYYNGSLDSIFGPKTHTAVLDFQKAMNLNANGIVGPETWHKLNTNTSFNALNITQQSESKPHISIDVVKKRLSYNHEETSKSYPVAVGKPSTPSPLGNWLIIEKIVDPGGPFGARWMRLSVPWGGYGIHGTNNPNSIGTAASHGCIRMYNEDVIELYDMTPIGTTVNIFGNAYTSRTLSRGDRGTDVKEVQKMLNKLGYYKYKIDGIFGRFTQEAVIRFQRNKKLKQDGIVGPITLEALQKYYDQATNDTSP
ncbi:L,D-transpeptidase [Candidatus Syntrophocurvum alkaliphilum]|uniref:L,D-transpeptidase n=1 Tax=Candidatus Syntrophocurvum alkaliphilum TaxID=2293317 RepID=A0A6I6DCN1_9FIRM|nr:peptidoglycan-binding protein [Candidatus Syntrophocurvum alkaliphilum]QGT99989.1 L,D-transpeptidase [Candidatus Syntrophocurvum alkaliphilum]